MCLAPPPPHQVLWAALLQLVQLSVHVSQVLVDVVQLGLQVFVLLVVAVELVLVVAALLLVCDGRKFTATRWKEETVFNAFHSGGVGRRRTPSYLSKSSSSSSSPEEL